MPTARPVAMTAATDAATKFLRTGWCSSRCGKAHQDGFPSPADPPLTHGAFRLASDRDVEFVARRLVARVVALGVALLVTLVVRLADRVVHARVDGADQFLRQLLQVQGGLDLVDDLLGGVVQEHGVYLQVINDRLISGVCHTPDALSPGRFAITSSRGIEPSCLDRTPYICGNPWGQSACSDRCAHAPPHRRGAWLSRPPRPAGCSPCLSLAPGGRGLRTCGCGTDGRSPDRHQARHGSEPRRLDAPSRPCPQP